MCLYSASFEKDSTGGHWNKTKAKLYINKLESIAAYFARMVYGKNQNNTSMQSNINKTTAKAAIIIAAVQKT